ncbi:MAG: rod shape-determining protein MreD [Spirochaetia bacterium]
MRKKNPVIYAVILIVCALLQNSVFTSLHIAEIRPDFTLLLLVFFAHQLGTMEGKIIGFLAGLVMDMLGMAPLGFHSLIYTVIGHFFGLTRGKMYVDSLTIPVVFAIAATLIVTFTSFIIAIIFLPVRLSSVLSLGVLIQIGMHAVLAPFIFTLLRVFKLCSEHETQML